jgi:hypothetical protein
MAIYRTCTLFLLLSALTFAQDQTLIEQLSANLQAGIYSSIEAVNAMNQDTSNYDLEQTFNYIYDVQIKAEASAISFEFVISNLEQLATNISQDSPDFYALSQLYDLASSGYEAYRFIADWMTQVSNALLVQDTVQLEALEAKSGQAESLLNNYAAYLESVLAAFDPNAPQTAPDAGMTALEYLEQQPDAYTSTETYGLLSEMSEWSHDLSMSVIDNFPSGGSGYYCRVGVDPGCY